MSKRDAGKTFSDPACPVCLQSRYAAFERNKAWAEIDRLRDVLRKIALVKCDDTDAMATKAMVEMAENALSTH